MGKGKFSFEDLEVWQKAINFATLAIELCDNIETGRNHYRLTEQIEAASSSVATNIAEGKGRYSKKEFVRFLYVARGSLYETITLLIILQKSGWVTQDQLKEIEELGAEIGRSISGLINSIRNPTTHEP